jgi:hypothetical protein
MLIVLALIVALAVLGPLFGADSRDGLDWAKNSFWLKRRGSASFRSRGSRARTGGGRVAADGRRTVPAAG